MAHEHSISGGCFIKRKPHRYREALNGLEFTCAAKRQEATAPRGPIATIVLTQVTRESLLSLERNSQLTTRKIRSFDMALMMLLCHTK